MLALAVLMTCVGCGGDSNPGNNVENPQTSANNQTEEPLVTPPETPAPVLIPLDYDKWEETYNGDGTSKFLNHGNGEFEIQNPGPNYAMFTQLVPVKPNMDYKFNVRFSMTDYQPGDENSCGACVAIGTPDFTGTIITGETIGAETKGETWEWNGYGLLFNSGNATSARLCLANGWFNAKSSGTAYFKEITLEELGTNESTNTFG